MHTIWMPPLEVTGTVPPADTIVMDPMEITGHAPNHMVPVLMVAGGVAAVGLVLAMTRSGGSRRRRRR